MDYIEQTIIHVTVKYNLTDTQALKLTQLVRKYEDYIFDLDLQSFLEGIIEILQ